MSVDRSPVELAARASLRAEARRAGARADAPIADGRLDDRERSHLRHVVRATVDAIAAGLGSAEVAPERIVARLMDAGLLGDPDLIDALLAGVRQDLLTQALVTQAQGGNRPSLLVRLAGAPDPGVAVAAAALLAADNLHRTDPAPADLPGPLRCRLIWRVAAALGGAEGGAVAHAAARLIARHDDDRRVEVVAMRLAAAIDASPGELTPLLIEALGDARSALFVALVAHGAGLPYAEVRDFTVVPGDDRLWLALRALRVERAGLAGIALLLAEADPRRDIEGFADRLDAIASIASSEARIALAPLALPADYRDAARALAAADAR